MATDAPPWVYHVEWPLDLSGSGVTVAGTARLRIILSPRPVGTDCRDDLVAKVVGTLELPPWTPTGGVPIEEGTALLRWHADGWHLAVQMPCRAGECALSVHLDAAPGDGSPANPELGGLTLFVDGAPRAHGKLSLHFRLFSLFALGQTWPEPVDQGLPAWRQRLQWWWQPS